MALGASLAAGVAGGAVMWAMGGWEAGLATAGLSLAGYVGLEAARRPAALTGSRWGGGPSEAGAASAAKGSSRWEPRWELFAVANAAAALTFVGALVVLYRFAADHPRSLHHPGIIFTSLPVLLALLGLLASITYMVGFCAVALVHPGLSEQLAATTPRAVSKPALAAPTASDATATDAAAAAAAPATATPSTPTAASTSSAPTVGAAAAAKAGPTSVALAARATIPDGEESTDVIVIGAGTAGSALASVLARDGRRVTLIESHLELPDRIIGELMQPGGVRTLERMGLGHCAKCAEVQGVRVDGYAILTPGATRAEDVVLTYPDWDPATLPEFVGLTAPPTGDPTVAPVPEAVDPHPRGRAFHNNRLVEQLRRVAFAEPNVNLRVGRAVRLLLDGDVDAGTNAKKARADAGDTVRGVVWKDAEAREHVVRAPFTVICDGNYSGFRKHASDNEPQVLSYFVGLVLRHEPFQTPLPHPFRGHVVLTTPTPTLLYQIAPTETRILVDVPTPLPNVEDGSLNRYLAEFTAPQLPDELRGPFLESLRTQDPIPCPNRTLTAMPSRLHRAVLIGDSLNMRHPLTGGGMTVALRDAEMISHLLRGLDLRDDAAVQRALDTFAKSRSSHASTVNILANALYRVFSAPTTDDGTRARLREACVEYLRLGGACSQGPVGLLSALTPRPGVLATHFFMVAAYAMRRAVFPYPTPSSLRRAYDLLHIACMIIMPLITAENVTLFATAPVRILSNLLFPWRGAALK